MSRSRSESVSSSGSDESAVEKQVDETLNNQEVVTKYRAAGDIAQRVLQKLIPLVSKPGTKVVQLCQVGDALILKEVSSIYNKKPKVEKGVAFPTCISVNNVVGHFSPLATDTTVVQEGDVVKIDLGVHIDGYAAVVAHTLVCGDHEEITGRKADVIVAAHTAAELVARSLAPGVKNTQITELMERVAKDFEVSPIQATLSHNVLRNQIAGKKEIISTTEGNHKVEASTVESLDVWAIDIQFSTGEGKPKELNKSTTVFKRIADVNYKLKMQASRFIASEIKSKFGVFPFTIRSIDDKRAKLGINECKTHGLVEAFPVVEEKPNDLVAHFKFTAMMMPAGIIKITGLPIDMAKFKPDHELKDAALKTLLTKSLRSKKKKSKSKSNATASDDAGAEPVSA